MPPVVKPVAETGGPGWAAMLAARVTRGIFFSYLKETPTNCSAGVWRSRGKGTVPGCRRTALFGVVHLQAGEAAAGGDRSGVHGQDDV